MANASERQDRKATASESDVESVNESPLKQIAAIIQTSKLSESNTDETDSEKMSEELQRMADKPPIKTPVCYSVNQIELLQTLGIFTFGSQYETDEFLQKVINLMDTTITNRLPTPWREKFRSLGLDQHDFLYMHERLVIPKTLRPIIMRSLRYGHPGRDSMLATLSNVWWPRLHRGVVTIARSCSQCRESGKNNITILTQNQVIKLPACQRRNFEIAIDFGGTFQKVINARKYLLNEID